ncbi:hypothetical protein H1R20_g8199, partial [Candolleomyces eurysporus]
MNILNVRCRATALRYTWSVVTPRTTSKPVVAGFSRNYATHRDDFDFATGGSSLARGFDSKRSADPKHESVGPFQLGLSQQALRTGKKVPKWSELDTKGKVLRTTARTTNLGVILVGAVFDAYGQEHMILSFYVKGKAEGSSQDPDLSYLEVAGEWIRDKADILPELEWEDAVKWSKDSASNIWDKSIRAFKYLSGAPSPPATPSPAPERQERQEPQKKESSLWDFVGVFSGLKGPASKSAGSAAKEDHRTFLDGDVHADLIRNKDGYFVFRYLLVDIPSSRDPNAVRVFVERAPGVRDNEPVMRFVSSS